MRRKNTLLVAGLLACLACASALPAHFSPDMVMVYKYQANIKAGTMVPDIYTSDFSIEAILMISQHLADPNAKNAFLMAFSNVTYGLYNGRGAHYEEVNANAPIPEAAVSLKQPFVVYFHDGDDHGKIKGIRVNKHETGWSLNMKQAIAAMLQLDLSSMKLTVPMEPHAFHSKEDTIYGRCNVAYDVHTMSNLGANEFVVTKLHEPKSCTKFMSHTFSNLQKEQCFVAEEDPMTTASRRYLEIENNESHIVIKKIIGHGVINFFPFQAQTDAHYLLTKIDQRVADFQKLVSLKQLRVLFETASVTVAHGIVITCTTLVIDVRSTSQTMQLISKIPRADAQQPSVDFENSTMVNDMSFKKPQGLYAKGAAVDITQGRHHVEIELLKPKLKAMLAEAADYLEENHINAEEPELKHGETINRLLRTMIYFDLESFNEIFSEIGDGDSPREVTIRNVFLNMIPHVGTSASCLFTLNAIRNMKVTDMMAINMLAMLPFNVRVPSVELLYQMESLIYFDERISQEVRKSSILCFASLIFETFKKENKPESRTDDILNTYIKHFFDHVQNESTYEMKMVYVQALQNVEIGVHKILEPVIRGKLMIGEKPQHIRLLAMMAAWKSATRDAEYAHELYYPILANTELPLQLRVLAYAILANQSPDMGRLMELYWLMVYEKNEHLYNFHYTTMKSLAQATSPCLMPMKEMARKLMRFIRVRPVYGPMASQYLMDYHNSMYDYGEMMRMMTMVDERTGMMNMGLMEFSASVLRKPVNHLTLYWRLEGVSDDLKNLFMKSATGTGKVSSIEVKELLENSSRDMPLEEKTHIELSIMTQDRVILTKHYSMNTMKKLVQDMDLFEMMKNGMKISWQHISYLHLYELQVPTDLGLPAVLATRLPNVMSLNMNYDVTAKEPSMVMKLQADMRMWSHGHYSMNIYNPIADVWHGIKRAFSLDMALPINVKVDLNMKSNILKITLPRLPEPKHSVSGIMMHTKSYVILVGDEQNLLQKFCSSCRHFQLITKGAEYRKKVMLMDADSKDTGMKYTMSVFDCEMDLSLMSFLEDMGLIQEDSWGSKILRSIMGMSRKPLSMLYYPRTGSCGLLMKMEPSVVHPVSQIVITLRASLEELGQMQKPMHNLPEKKINLHGTLQIKAPESDDHVRSWDLNAILDMSNGHTNNSMKLQITRSTPNEKDFKICVEGEKIFPVINDNLQDPRVMEEETNGKLKVSMGLSEDGKCGTDVAGFAVTMKGEFSEEQKNMFTHDSIHGTCMQGTQKPRHQTEHEMLPGTHPCVEEAIRHTTLRKYSFKAAYKNMPQEFVSMAEKVEEMLHFMLMPYKMDLKTRTREGNVELIVEYPMMRDGMHLAILTPAHGYKYLDLPVSDASMMMDNVHFSKNFLQSVKLGNIKICSIHPETMINADNGIIPFVIPNQWILLSGDHVSCRFAVFAKNIGARNMAMKMFMTNHTLEVMPTDEKPVVTVDGQVIGKYEDGILIPEGHNDDYAMRVTVRNGNIITVESKRIPIQVEWTMKTVTLFLDTSLQGKVTGICGQMDGMHKNSLPEIYTVSEI